MSSCDQIASSQIKNTAHQVKTQMSDFHVVLNYSELRLRTLTAISDSSFIETNKANLESVIDVKIILLASPAHTNNALTNKRASRSHSSSLPLSCN